MALTTVDGALLGTNATPQLNGVQFPATQVASANANTLDDYEEGTWTPIITFGGSSSSGAVYSNQTGYYTRVGNIVQVQCLCVWTNKGSSTGNFGLAGLPFPLTSYCGIAFSPTGISYTGIPTGQGSAGESASYFYQMSTAGAKTALTNSNVSASGELIINMVYRA